MKQEEKTKTYSWDISLRNLGLRTPLKKEYQAELTKALADQSSNYEKIDIDAENGRLLIYVYGVKPRLGKFLEDNYDASDIEGETLH